MKIILKHGRAKISFEAWNDDYVHECKKVLEAYDYKMKHLDKMYWLGFHE